MTTATVPRPLDHLVLPVWSLGEARRRLASLGFTVAPDARHPFGTGNACVFFRNRTYLEPLAVLDEATARRAEADGLFFVSRAKAFLATRGEGFAMVALKDKDAEAAQRAFEAAGVSAGPMFEFARLAAQPDGSEREIGVRLAYAADPRAPDATLFACEAVGRSVNSGEDFVDHPNGALGVASVTAVAGRPAEFDAFLSAVAGEPETGVASQAPDAGPDAARIVVLTPDAFRETYGLPAPDPGPGFVLAAFDVAVRDLADAQAYAGANAVRRGGRILVPPAPGLGAVLAFRSTEHD